MILPPPPSIFLHFRFFFFFFFFFRPCRFPTIPCPSVLEKSMASFAILQQTLSSSPSLSHIHSRRLSGCSFPWTPDKQKLFRSIRELPFFIFFLIFCPIFFVTASHEELGLYRKLPTSAPGGRTNIVHGVAPSLFLVSWVCIANW